MEIHRLCRLLYQKSNADASLPRETMLYIEEDGSLELLALFTVSVLRRR